MKSATPEPKAMTPSKKSKHEEFKTPTYAAHSSPSMNYATPDPKALTSTPGPLADNIQPMSDMSRISSSESERQADDSDAHISGIEELPSRRRSHLKESSSFINPFV
ncbi:uncharacterized protein LOC127732487 [Mytilus californianus]|uniref:uncharacterized protein LOC127732487 n=1 Tax=Mytilus californianus TaxID=6549 RepID=UPI002247B8FC|nr:uncharacterized protein LOC127732487 [Mytilus californianus]